MLTRPGWMTTNAQGHRLSENRVQAAMGLPLTEELVSRTDISYRLYRHRPTFSLPLHTPVTRVLKLVEFPSDGVSVHVSCLDASWTCFSCLDSVS